MQGLEAVVMQSRNKLLNLEAEIQNSFLWTIYNVITVLLAAPNDSCRTILEKYLCLQEQLFHLKLVHCAEFILTGHLLNVKGGLCCDPGHCRIGHLARIFTSYSCCSLASSYTTCIPLKYSPMHMDCRIHAGS